MMNGNQREKSSIQSQNDEKNAHPHDKSYNENAQLVSSSDDDEKETDSSTIGGFSSHSSSSSGTNNNKNNKRPYVDKSRSCKQARIIQQKLQQQQQKPWHYQPRQTRDLKACFRILKHIGEGTFGSVFLTLDREEAHPAQKQKTIKRVKTRDDKSVPVYGFPYTALREIKLLESIEHRNVIKMHEVVTQAGADGLPGQVFIVLEYMEYDLAALLRMPVLAKRLTKDHVQSWTRQLLQGCQYLHEQHIMHRDLKPSNLLVDKQGTLKIGDFGLARKVDDRQYTNSTIGTPWYRAPEILIGSASYGTEVDMWSTGCILFELASQKPMFHAKVTFDLCQQMDKKCALIKEDTTWLPKEMAKTRNSNSNNSNITVSKHDMQLAKLISTLVQLDPKSRLSARDALNKCEFLQHLDGDSNRPKLNMNFPLSSCHELDVFKFRQQQQHGQLERN